MKAAPRRRRRRYPFPRSRAGHWLLLGGFGFASVMTTLLLEWEASHRTCTLTGRLDLAGQPLPDAEVRIAGTRRVTTSDSAGLFELKRVPIGCVTVMVHRDTVTAGYPVKVPPAHTWDLGDVPIYLWRPRSGVLTDPAAPIRGREVVRFK